MSSNEIKYEVTPKHEGGQFSEGTLDNDVTQNLQLRYVCPRVQCTTKAGLPRHCVLKVV